MDVRVTDNNLTSGKNGAVIDEFDSCIWTDRYDSYGDFELCLPVNQWALSQIRADYYVNIDDSDRTMIVENIQIITEVESGAKLMISGRSLESILDRRIIWAQTILNGSFQNSIRRLLEENAISPADPKRMIPNLIFEMSSDPAIVALTVDVQFTGDNLYTAINELCLSKNVGFKIVINDDNKFVFKLYSGVDHSYRQALAPYVIFSPTFDNLVNSHYLMSKRTLKNVTLVAGEGEGAERKTLFVATNDSSGLDRRELFTDARDVSSNIGEVLLPLEEYNKLLRQRGEKSLSENKITESFEGETDAANTFQYGIDFGMGDLIQIENEYGIQAAERITEMVHSYTEAGYTALPTFSAID